MATGYHPGVVVDHRVHHEGTCDHCGAAYSPLARLTEERGIKLMNDIGLDPEYPSKGVFLCRPCYEQFEPLLLDGVPVIETPTQDEFVQRLIDQIDESTEQDE